MDSMDLDNVRGTSRNEMISIREEAQTPSNNLSMQKVNMLQQSSPQFVDGNEMGGHLTFEHKENNKTQNINAYGTLNDREGVALETPVVKS